MNLPRMPFTKLCRAGTILSLIVVNSIGSNGNAGQLFQKDGPMIVPFGTGKYDLGLFQTNAGPLYVSSGIGWFFLNLRFCCRPEIVVFEI